ncbi:MAG: MFS transporter [Chloroflexi bacterium]|nr:MFS transporter [Chloroflexota bacterium]
MSSLAVYRELLGNRPLTKLLIGEFISGIGDWLYIVAIFVVIYTQTNDAALLGAFGAVRLVPYILLSIPAGFVADRFERRLVLLASDAFRGSIMILLTILVIVKAPITVIAALAIVAAGGSAFFYPAMGAYMPSLVRDERELGPANSAWASLQNISYIVGPAIGGILLAVGGVEVAFILNAASFLVIIAILWTLPPKARPVASGSVGSGADAAVGTAVPVEQAAGEPAATLVEALGGQPAAAVPASTAPGPAAAPTPTLATLPLAGLGIIQFLGGFLGGGLQVLTTVLAIHVLNAGESANGYLNAAIGIGGLLGAIGSGVLVLRRGLGVPLVVGSVVLGVGLLVLGAVPNLMVALVAIAIVSAGALVVDIITTTVFQRIVPDALRGRWTGVFMTVGTISGAAGAFLLPVLVVNIGAAIALGTSGAAMVVATVAGLALIGGAATREPSRFEATLAEIAKLPLFTGVPGSRLEAALAHMRERPVTTGEVIVRQGDPADRFYMIESGSFVVTQEASPGAAPVTLRHLGVNQAFGELGLLNRAPRSATVTAEADGVLLELAGRDFLRLVGAGGPLRGRLLGLYSGGPATDN